MPELLNETELVPPALPCSACGERFDENNLFTVREEVYCQACFDDRFHMCESCDVVVSVDDMYYSEIRDAGYCRSCAGEELRFCTSCDMELTEDGTRETSDGAQYCESCYPEDEDPEADHIQIHETSGRRFERCRSARKFGVEIEVCLDESKCHLPVSDLGFWCKQRDGSLGDSGREYASPILQGDEGFEEIERFSGVLKRWGYFIKQKCGLHVHIDGRDFSPEDIKTLLKLTRTYEPVIYAMLPSSRLSNTYSVPLERFPRSRFRIRVADAAGLKALWYGPKGLRVNTKSKYHNSRYYGLNIHSWFYRGSFEFRYHSGTINPEKITNFIVICQALVDKAKEIRNFRTRSFKDVDARLRSFTSLLELPTCLCAYIRERIAKFHPEYLAPPSRALEEVLT